ncbi:MAG: archease [Phycisphaerae bacterium]|nr:archease [Phycisphaerae bacterium]
MKHFEHFEHTADIGIAALGDSIGELYEGLAEGLAEFICPRAAVATAAVREVAVEAEDGEALAVDFLSAVLNVIQADRFMIAAVRAREADEHRIVAELVGEPYDPTRHEIHTEVKAVTYHLLKVAREAGRWGGRVVLDL